MCVAASGNVSMFFKERAAASERYQCAPASERKCAADIFFILSNCVAASENNLMFFKEHAAVCERYVQLLLKEKCAAAF